MSLFDAIAKGRDTSGDAAARLWWLWRMYLTAKHEPARAAALLHDIDQRDDQARDLFDRVYSSRLTGARLTAPDDATVETRLLSTLVAEAEQGHVPIHAGPEGMVKLKPVPTGDPFATVATPTDTDLTTLAQRYRIPVTIAGGVLALVLVGWLFLNLQRPRAALSAANATPEARTTATARTTPTPHAATAPLLGRQRDRTPASLQVGDVVYTVVATSVQDRRWVVQDAPGVASWLQGTYAHPVVCVPSLDGVPAGTVIQLRDMTGAVRRYVADAPTEVADHQIEVLAPHRAGATVLPCRSVGGVRPVVVAEFQP